MGAGSLFGLGRVTPPSSHLSRKRLHLVPGAPGASGLGLWTLTLLPSPSAGDPATALPRGLLRPPLAICGLHLHLGQVRLVLTHLVGGSGLPDLAHWACSPLGSWEGGQKGSPVPAHGRCSSPHPWGPGEATCRSRGAL